MQKPFRIHPVSRFAAFLAVVAVLAALAAQAEPIRLDPENPHYFLFRGRPTVLITSTEHYGSVLNPDFDYLTYLDTLQADGLNLTRTVDGDFVESPDAKIWRGGDQNTLAPRPGRYLAPWARSDQPGYYGGGNKFDLNRWNEHYFKRLRDFVQAASDRGIVVEFNAFYVMYGEGPSDGGWVLSPLNARNNINGVGRIPWYRYNTLDDAGVVARQDALLRKTLTELNRFDNVYYEICDEPYWSGASPAETTAWENHLIHTFVVTERALPKKHLIAENFTNYYPAVKNPPAMVSVFNFHYASPPVAVPMNWRFNRPIMFDETKNGADTIARRHEAWAFMLSGGAGYDNLDPSFATDDPTGSGKVEQPDGRYDNRPLRAQLGVLKKFMESLDFIHMRPDQQLLNCLPGHSGMYYALENPGKVYAVYFLGGSKPARRTFDMDLPAGRWQAEWIDPANGVVTHSEIFEHHGEGWLTETPEFTEDLALRLTALPSPSS